ncbi:Flp family type IVb pilin [Mesorhizobium sanjuanii]|uniref:Flp family type IVb pilin n=1 Tax=Mesorhizobium sanjuanii TaxID=2037900 RepID=A0A2A6FAQ6_9HYPH|nr:Flp family type IVb pilin [Mesorhizobium sanjuanii]PDQ18805.1 Flp family type IVb pilin [Mesorhizobium sanjuanii]
MKTVLQRFLEDETGATVVEYGLIVTVLSLGIVAGASQVFDAIEWLFSDSNSKLVNAFAP